MVLLPPLATEDVPPQGLCGTTTTPGYRGCSSPGVVWYYYHRWLPRMFLPRGCVVLLPPLTTEDVPPQGLCGTTTTAGYRGCSSPGVVWYYYHPWLPMMFLPRGCVVLLPPLATEDVPPQGLCGTTTTPGYRGCSSPGVVWYYYHP